MAGKIAPLSMTPVETLPDAVQPNGRGAPSRWPGILSGLVTDFAPSVWVKIRDYTPPMQAKLTLNKLVRRIEAGEFPGITYANGAIVLNGTSAIHCDARTIETDGVKSSVLHMGWAPFVAMVEAEPEPEMTVTEADTEG